MSDHASTITSVPAFGLIVVGDEILSGKRADKHMSKLIELLSARGLSLAWSEYVGDVPERITFTLSRAFASGGVVFCTGGIGATPDDHTRQCAAAALKRPLVLHPEAKALIEQRMQEIAQQQGQTYQPDHPDHVHRLNMGVFPEDARIIPNPYNKIPGFSCTVGSWVAGQGAPAAPPQATTVHFVPGFPVMAWPMMEWVLDTYYGALFHQYAQAERSVIVFGAMEAALTPLMLAVERSHPAVRVFSLPSVDHPSYGRHIELGVKGPAAAVACAYADLRAGLIAAGAHLGPELGA